MNSSADVQEWMASGNLRPSSQQVEDVADVFALLGDPGRVRLLVALLPGELCVADLADRSGHSASGVSHALTLLRAHRVVASRREGRKVFYRLEDPHVRHLLELTFTHTAEGALEHPEREARR
jgi:DNA-binding transcriptional ArsR family regulator